MKSIKKLPDAEFDVMKVIWKSKPPVTTLEIMASLSKHKEWKPQTVLTLLVRLIEKGFLSSERVGRERNYIPIIDEQAYLQIETGNFMERYFGNSLGSMVKTMYDGKNLTEEDIQELKKFLAERV